jgi:EAL domain-containing protein (putative c-di-GMP-specific phosphodiesterase class I)/GGDEF domain-containing protein
MGSAHGFPDIYSEIEKSIEILLDEDAKSVSLMLVNINNFTSMNEIFGRDFADRVLGSLLVALNSVADGLPCFHIFADNFGIITSSENLTEEIASRVIDVFEDEQLLDDIGFYLSLSIGIATVTSEKFETDLNKILNQATTALKNSKKDLLKGYSIYKGSRQSIFKGRDIHYELVRAISNGDIEFYLQPKYNKLGIIASAEALVRWNHPELGLLSPFHFIDYAEKSWIISDLTKLSIDCAFRMIHSNFEAGYQIPIAVNFSSRVLNEDPSIVPYIEQHKHMERYIELLEVEILETGTVDSRSTMETMRRLTMMGVELSLDDFGTGSSSLTYLSTFPISTVKIDKSFIDKVQTPFGHTIVKSIVDLAKNLNLKTVAEGVEIKEQLDLLTILDVDYIQGYYYSKPLPYPDFLKLLKKQEKS